jgi:hypothetical protein
MVWDNEVIASTERPFSDKLMLFHTTALIGYGTGIYGLNYSNSMRSDIAAAYVRLIAETSLYSRDGIILMTNNGWSEKMPGAANHNIVV